MALLGVVFTLEQKKNVLASSSVATVLWVDCLDLEKAGEALSWF